MAPNDRVVEVQPRVHSQHALDVSVPGVAPCLLVHLSLVPLQREVAEGENSVWVAVVESEMVDQLVAQVAMTEAMVPAQEMASELDAAG